MIHDRLQRILGHCALVVGCHQRIERSYVIRGRQVPVCCRCLGILFGLCIAPIFFGFMGFWCGLLLLPLIADGSTQARGLRASRNWLRLTTGILFGIGVPNFLIVVSRNLVYGIRHRVI